MLEQPDASPEKYWHQVYHYLVEEPGRDALLHDARGHHGDALLARDRFRSPHGAFDPVRDELERRSCVDPSLRDRVGDDEGGYAQGGPAAPPARDVERPASRHGRPHRVFYLPKELGALLRNVEDHLGTRQPVFGVAARVPREESLAAVAQR